MTKSEIIAHLADAADVSKKTAAQMLDALTILMYREAGRGFTVPGLGKLVLAGQKRLTPDEVTAIVKAPPAKVVKFQARAYGRTPRPAGPIQPINKLHDPANGRVDAERVASYLNEPLAFIASALQRKYSTVAKTPAAPSLQAGLLDFKRILEVLEHVLGDAQSVRIWMNTPHPDLDGMTPRAVTESGNVSAIRRMIDSSLSGNLS